MTPAPAVRLGLTLPSFRSDPEPVIAVARVADAAGVDGVFAFDHLFRMRGDAPGGEPRPALELLTTMAAVAAETSRVVVGSLVARTTLRPPATLVAAFDTLARIAPGRLVAGLGSGDHVSEPEDDAFGVDVPDRLGRLAETVALATGRGYPVWVGGNSPAVRRVAADGADGWNAWGGDAAGFARLTAGVRDRLGRAGRDAGLPGSPGVSPWGFACSWGGLAVVGATQAEAERKLGRLGGPRPGVLCGGPERVAEAVGEYAAAGAAWVVLGPLDPSDPDNAAVLGEAVRPLL